MKMHGTVESYLHSFLTLALDADFRCALHIWLLIRGVENLQCPLARRLDGFQF